MKRKVVGSSILQSFGYDDKHSILEIELKGDVDNHIYQYFGVPESVYKRFLKTDSFGRFYNRYIKGKYLSICMTKGLSCDVDEYDSLTEPIIVYNKDQTTLEKILTVLEERLY